MVQLNEKELRALSNFLSEKWQSFLSASSNYLNEEEADALFEKLDKQ